MAIPSNPVERAALVRKVWRRASTDVVFFCNTFLPKKPHPGQIKWLTSSTASVNTLVPGNRWGKSTVIAMKHIWHCMFKIGVAIEGNTPAERSRFFRTAEYDTISVAMSADQAEIVFKEAKRLLAHKALRPFVTAFRSTPFPHIVFANGSVMHCRSAHDDGKYIDGHAYRYLSIDEAGWITKLKSLMTNVIIMRLAGGGVIDLIGTPKGYNDLYFYYERGQRKIKGYYSQRGSIYDNPHLPDDDIKMRDALLASADPKVRQQVLFGEFVDFTGLAFTRDQRDNAFDPALPEHERWIEGHKYVNAWDLGRTTDFTVGCVLDITTRPWRLVSYTRLNRVAWEEIYATIDRVRKEYHCTWARIDATGPQGDVIEEEMSKRGIPVDPYKTSNRASKVELINTLQNALDEGRQALSFVESLDDDGSKIVTPILQEPGEGNWGTLRLPTITQLMDEMGIYSLDDKNITFTDSVMSLSLAAAYAYEFEGLSAPVEGGLYADASITPAPVMVPLKMAVGPTDGIEVLGAA